MVWKYAYDRDKAEILSLHLIKAARKVEDKHVTRKRLVTQLKKIRALRIDKKLTEHVDELERRINDLVATEKKIMANQQREDFFHRQLIDKINRLDRRLKDYLLHHKEREDRFKTLEKKVYKTLTKDQKIARLKGQISGLELLYENLVASKTANPSQLQKMKDQINALKKKQQELFEKSQKEAAEITSDAPEHIPPRGLFASALAKQDQVIDDLGPAPPPPQ